MKATRQKTPKITEYPSYPHTSGRMGTTANDSSPHRNRNGLLRFFVDCWMWVRELEGVWCKYLGILGFIFL